MTLACSSNSSKPPSSDGFRLRENLRPKSGKPTGGQAGHPGHTLQQGAEPDQVIMHRPTHCEACHCELPEAAGRTVERQQIHELPEVQVQVTEHRVEAVGCPACGHVTVAPFPTGVHAPVQYGSRLRAVAVYLSQFQLLPMGRIGELCADLWGCALSDGTLASWIAEAASTLEPTMQVLKGRLLASRLTHVDETGVRIKGLLHWMHVAATRWLTVYGWHRKRGQEAIDAIGVLPQYQGRTMHDRWRSYDRYPCAHSVCGAHFFRDCLFVAEQEKRPWAQAMYELLLQMKETADAFRAQGAKAVPQAERDALVLQYFEVLRQGFAEHFALAPPGRGPAPKKPGRKSQNASENLLDALLKRAEQVLAFLDDLSVPFTNNQAERDLRMIKVQQKISGTFRSEHGASAFCVIRSYLSTMRKQGRSMLAALAAVFEGSPFPIAWEPGT
ncbi:IS66 family transposase [Ktedonobacter racemifer]|uniref:Transposase n=1 Tax=Ktedonobacter racemifer DSM 44963 TaxID=485913 RepID=D6TG82_KTERA|nr:IS66 family transposase [Ktedonobacter racemifer]EFH88784.1 transposase [Ktedonobacter racemifer DSM 44963]